MDRLEAIAARAMALVDTPFLLGGRDPAQGVDCIGLAWLTLGKPGPVPGGYRLRGGSAHRWREWFASAGFAPVHDRPNHGDLWLVRVGPLHLHLLVAVPGGFVHAHAGLRRVVFLPGDPPWPVEGIWRAPPQPTHQVKETPAWPRSC